MNGGINQLVDTYKGNPQPLETKVQKAQQSQPPGKIPPDLEEAMALQKIADLRNSAQGQQAMQAGGAQQSIVDKLRQMLAGNQAQAQMAGGPPVMAARGGSIDQLMSNLGHNYAGGGIIAFSKQTDENNRSLVNDSNTESSQFAQDIAKIPQAFDDLKQRAREEDATRAAQDRRMAQYKQDKLAAQQKTSLFNYLFGSPTREKEGIAKLTEMSNAPLNVAAEKPDLVKATPPADIRSQLNTADAARFAEKPAPKLPAAPAANVPPTANVNAPVKPATPDKPAEEVMSPMETALQKSIMDALAKDPEAVRKKAMEQNAQFMGLDALLKPAQDRAASRETMIKQIQADRQPLWITALQNAGNKPGNIAQVLNQMATGTNAAKQGYNTQDLKFLDELSDLYANIDKAKIEGRYKDVAAGKEAVKDLIAEQRQAEQSGTSLLNTKENVRSREQIAKDAAAGRAQVAAGQAQTAALAREERTRQFNETELRKIREKDVDRAAKIETAIAKRTAMIDMQLQNPKLKPEEETALQARRNAIVNQVKAEYPSVKPEKPSEGQFLAAARAANPGVSDADLKAYYKQNYGT